MGRMSTSIPARGQPAGRAQGWQAVDQVRLTCRSPHANRPSPGDGFSKSCLPVEPVGGRAAGEGWATQEVARWVSMSTPIQG